MEYLVYCRDRPDSMPLREKLSEEHWSFMDQYAEAMIARGPTMTADGSAATGSAHFVDLPDAEAARVFAFEEPNYKAGVYDEVLVWRWRNLLGRTMWEFPGEVPGYQRFLILGHGKPGMKADDDGEFSDRLIAYGPLLSDDGSEWLGTALLVELPDRASAEAVLPPSRYTRIEVHHWQFGGRH